MKKRIWSFLSLAIFLFLLPTMTHAAADSPIRLFLNDTKLEPLSPPYLSGSTTMVPARVISESLGAVVNWDDATHKMTVVLDQKQIEIVENSMQGYVNGERVALPAAPVVKAGTMMLPVRFFAEQFDFTVQWDAAAQAVYLKTPDAVAAVGGYNELWSVNVASESVTIQAAEGMTPTVFQLSDPDRIAIDIPGAVVGGSLPRLGEGDGSMVTLACSNPLVAQIRYSLFDVDSSTVRIVLDTNGKVPYEVVSQPGADKLVLALKKPASRTYKVVIDPGHGGHDSGAVSLTGKYEKTFNLSVAKKVKALLDKEPNITAYITRSDDTFIPLDDRAAFANNLGADAFVSIHGNSFTPASNGTQTYYYNSYSRPLADTLQKYLVAATGFRDDLVHQEDFRVVRKTDMPGVLLEVGYLTNQTEEALMFTSAFQDKVAAAIANGIKAYLGL
jgi:N-acetylmuramoyl-L-alanine amidase